jgi:hypothetical protein
MWVSRRKSDLIFVREAPFTVDLMVTTDNMDPVCCCVDVVYDCSQHVSSGDCSPRISTEISSQCSATVLYIKKTTAAMPIGLIYYTRVVNLADGHDLLHACSKSVKQWCQRLFSPFTTRV